MKKFLSMVLALVMTMSLVTVSAGAKEFKDDEQITYDEAVAVISEIGVVDGDTNGTFRPTDTLTRQAAAKIICNLILGPTTAAELHADTAPYKDVAANNQFAGYIAYCQSRGIISGYADGTFRPTGTLTGYAFMKMLLGALGYDSTLEGYVGSNWSINVAKQALGIGLNKGLQGEFNGIKAVTREEACLYAFRTIQSDLVEYGQRLTTSINGTEVTLSAGGAQSRPWQSQQTRINHIREDDIVQFAEEYFKKLEKKPDTDHFERPGYTWIYDKEEIGTYVDWELMAAEYFDKVTGRDIYDRLGLATLRANEVKYYVDGLEPSAGNPTWFNTNVAAASKNIDKEDLNRNNDSGLGVTGRGVLTQVFVDKDNGLITIASIDTWLGQASADYSASKEYAPVNVYYGNGTSSTLTTNWNVDVEDVKNVVDVKNDDYLLVNISWKENTKGLVVEIAEPEILEDSTVTKYSADGGHDGGKVSKLTTGGTEYKATTRAYYDAEVLWKYNESLLTNATYNVFMDKYGNFIGVELAEGEKNYVFITGFDRPTSNLSISTANATGIFLDGTMDVVKVNVTDTNKNIRKVNGYKNGVDSGYNAADVENNGEYFIEWTNGNLPGIDGSYRYNRWFTYSVNEAGTYTLKPATNMNAHKYYDDAPRSETIRTATVYLDDNVLTADTYPYGDDYNTAPHTWNGGAVASPVFNSTYYAKAPGQRSYGNDDSVFITVDMDRVDTMSIDKKSITGVNGVYTGVQNVEIEINHQANAEEAEIYTVYNADHYIIGAVIVGEGKGANSTIAYVMGGPKSERIEDGIYYWEFDAIVGGEKQTLTAKSKYREIFDTLVMESDPSHKSIAKASGAGRTENGDDSTLHVLTALSDTNLKDGLVELRFDAAEEYVVGVRAVEEKSIYSDYGVKGLRRGGNSLGDAKRLDEVKAYRINGVNKYMLNITPDTLAPWGSNAVAVKNGTETGAVYDSAPDKLSLQGRTLYVTEGQKDEGLALASDCKAVVIQRENGSWEDTYYTSVANALAAMADWDNDPDNGLTYRGEIVAAVNSAGAATWVVFTNYAELVTGTAKPIGGSGRLTAIDVIPVNATAAGWDRDTTGATNELGYSNPAYDYYNASPAVKINATYDAAPGTYGTGNISYKLIGTNAGETYTITLEGLSGAAWVPTKTWTVTTTGAGSSTIYTVNVGILTATSQWRLVCGNVMAGVAVITASN